MAVLRQHIFKPEVIVVEDDAGLFTVKWSWAGSYQTSENYEGDDLGYDSYAERACDPVIYALAPSRDSHPR